MSEATHAYLGKAPCGCVRGLIVDDPDHQADVYRELAKWTKGTKRTPPWTIEKVTIEASRTVEMRWDDPHDIRKRRKAAEPAEPAEQEALL
jgi:hypothetical protein